MGILADHVPTIQQLRPGLVEIVESTGKSTSYFVSGGFATVSEGSKIAINVVEAFKPEDFSAEVCIIITIIILIFSEILIFHTNFPLSIIGC